MRQTRKRDPIYSRATKVSVKQTGTTSKNDGVVDTISQNEHAAQHFLIEQNHRHVRRKRSPCSKIRV